MRTASRPALRAPPMETVATGTPAGICTMDSRESMPSRVFSGTGHADHGQGSDGGEHAGKVGGAAGAGDDDAQAAALGCLPVADHLVGIRWAETTSASKGMPNSARASAAASITGQSESEPITRPTSGCRLRRSRGFRAHGVSGAGVLALMRSPRRSRRCAGQGPVRHG